MGERYSVRILAQRERESVQLGIRVRVQEWAQWA